MSATRPRSSASSTLPREIAPGIFWFSTCLEVPSESGFLHNHNGCFLVRGTKASVLIDTAMPSGWPTLQGQLRAVMGGEPIDYLFPTHPEAPHMGNLGPLMSEYPNALVVGDVRNYHLYYPQAEHRLRRMHAGETIELGARRLELLPAIIHDLPNTLWAYEPHEQVLFLCDAYPYTHAHEAGQCGMTAEEYPRPVQPDDCNVVLERAMSWTRHVKADAIIRELDTFFELHPARILAPAHGGVVYDAPAMTAIFKDALRRVRGAA